MGAKNFMKTSYLAIPLLLVMLGLSGCSFLAKEYVRHVAHTTDLDNTAPAPVYSPFPEAKPDSFYAPAIQKERATQTP